MAMYFKEPFADAGDRTTIPSTVQPDGSVSYPDGYGVDYQLDPSAPPGLNIERPKFNELMYQVTLALQQYQQMGFPDFITSADNGGSPFPYAINATVRFAGGWGGAGAMNYYSLVDTNVADPTDPTKWGLVQYGTQTFITGDMMMWAFNTIRTGGWVWMNGTTIGDGTSGATGRANADTLALFTMLWTDYSNTVLPIQDSSGAASVRGISAAADFGAHKRLPVPDYRGRSFFGIDNMGGAATAGRITNAESSINGTTLGASGGAQSVALTSNQNGAHTHTATTDNAGTHSHTGTTNSSGDHQHFIATTQPSDFADLQANNYLTNYNNDGGFFSYRLRAASPPPNPPTPPSVGLTNVAGAHTHTFTTDTAGNHNHPVNVASSGIGATHQNMPPAMIGGGFIMKL